MLERFFLKLRGRYEYTAFLVFPEWPFGLTVIGLGLSFLTVALIPSSGVAFEIAVTVVGILVAITTAGRELHAALSKWSPFSFRANQVPAKLEIKPPESEPGAEYIETVASGTVLTHPRVDQLLRSTPLQINIDGRYRLPERLRAMARESLRVSFRPIVFNRQLLGLTSTPAMRLDRTAAVRIHTTRYFNSLCSNEICKYVVSDGDGHEVDLRKQELLDWEGRLRPLDQCKLSNHIGVSTLAFTADGLLVVCQATLNNVAGRVQVLPSGSGTIRPNDRIAGDTLQSLLIRSMERELVEEAGVETTDIVSTYLLGFGRWLERGAKPEFYGHAPAPRC